LIEQVERRGATLLVITHDHGLLDRFGRVIDLRALIASGASTTCEGAR
jgi:ABC-type lipoprotein export system ATPase subunit